MYYRKDSDSPHFDLPLLMQVEGVQFMFDCLFRQNKGCVLAHCMVGRNTITNSITTCKYLHIYTHLLTHSLTHSLFGLITGNIGSTCVPSHILLCIFETGSGENDASHRTHTRCGSRPRGGQR